MILFTYSQQSTYLGIFSAAEKASLAMTANHWYNLNNMLFLSINFDQQVSELKIFPIYLHKWPRKAQSFHTAGTKEFICLKINHLYFHLYFQHNSLIDTGCMDSLTWVLCFQQKSGKFLLQPRVRFGNDPQTKLKPCEIFTMTMVQFMPSAGK